MPPTGQRYTFALCPETPLVRARDLQRMAVALEYNAQHCAKAWNFHPPAVVVADRDHLPKFCRPIVFMEAGADTDTLAVHYVDPVRNAPAARVNVDKTSGLASGPFSACESAAHELLEMLGNPLLNVWMPWPAPRSDSAIETPRELCDATQDTYTIEHARTLWPVANFLMPAWFDLKLSDAVARAGFRDAGIKFDYCDRMSEPGEISPEGYVVLRAPKLNGAGFNYWEEWAFSGRPAVMDHAKRSHPWSRSKQLREGR